MYTLDLYRKYRNVDKNKIDSFIKFHFKKIDYVFTNAIEKEAATKENVIYFYNYLFIKLMNFYDSILDYKDYIKFLEFQGLPHIEKKDYVDARKTITDEKNKDTLDNYFNNISKFYFNYCKEFNKIKYADSLLDFSMLMVIKYNKDLDDLAFDLDHTMDILLDNKKEVIGDYNNNVFIINDDIDLDKFKNTQLELINKYELVTMILHGSYNKDYSNIKYNGEVLLSFTLVLKSEDLFQINYEIALTYDSKLSMSDIENKISEFFLELGDKYKYFNLDSVNYNEDNYRVKYLVNPKSIKNIGVESNEIKIYLDNESKIYLPDNYALIFFQTELMSKYNFKEDFDDIEYINKDILNKYIEKGYEFIFDLKDLNEIEEAFRIYELIKDYIEM